MYVLIERYMERLTMSQVVEFANKNGVTLSDEEAVFVFDFVKKNWRYILSNKGVLDISKYKEKFSEENFVKIERLIKEYAMKYSNYL